MSNYTPTGNPVQLNRAASPLIRAEFSSIATAVASKGDSAGQVWLGTHDYTGASIKVPTLPYGSTGNYAVSFDALNNYILTSALPGQLGNAGKFLSTNGTTASWTPGVMPVVLRSARTSNTILGAADSQAMIDITSGTFTQTFSACATLGTGWYCYIRNSGTGDITLDPNGAELIDGLASYIMYPFETRLIFCTGTALFSIVISGFSRKWTTTSAANFTKPPGYAYFDGEIIGSGNSGLRSHAATDAHGGGGGGCFPFSLPASLFAATETFTIGAGGLGVATPDTSNLGGITSIGSLISISANATYDQGSSINGSVSAGNNSFGFEASSLNSIYGGGNFGGSSINGAAGGGSYAAGIAAPGTSKFAGNGGAASDSGTASDGVAPGGGGGASRTGTAGSGARGEIRMRGRV